MTVKATKRTYAIGLFLMTGWTPWGVQLPWPGISLCGGSGHSRVEWIMCCGHVLSPSAMDDWMAAGLAAEGGPDRFGRRTAVAGPALQAWLMDAFDGLKVQHWGQTA